MVAGGEAEAIRIDGRSRHPWTVQAPCETVGTMSYIRLILPDENDVNFEGVTPPESYTTNNGEYVLVRVTEAVDATDDAAGHHEAVVAEAWYERKRTI